MRFYTSYARRIIEAEAEAGTGSTLVIHLDDRSTDFLKPIYQGMGYPVITGRISKEELMDEIRKHSRIYAMGHGSPSGLFGAGFMIGDEFGPLLAEKQSGLYIWCNADAYAVRNGLSGMVSGMFISEVGEAAMFGIEASQEEVDRSNDLFAKVVREHLDGGNPLAQVRQCYSHPTCSIVKFNSDRLYTFESGVPSPALHPTSMGIPYHQRQEPPAPVWRTGPAHQGPGEAAGGRLGLFDEWKQWYSEFRQLLPFYDLDFRDITEDERYHIKEMFMDGAWPDEAVEAMVTWREGAEDKLDWEPPDPSQMDLGLK